MACVGNHIHFNCEGDVQRKWCSYHAPRPNGVSVLPRMKLPRDMSSLTWQRAQATI
jgi:hypothetical protein